MKPSRCAVSGVLRALPVVLLLLVLAGWAEKPAPAPWPPLASADLAMTSFPGQPGAGAIILDRSLRTDGKHDADTWFVRIKVLTEAGVDQGSVHIPYDDSEAKVVGIEARTIEPDGTVVAFNGQIYDSVLARLRGFKLRQKTFSMPDVRAGCVLEYRYRIVWHNFGDHTPTWNIQSKLFIRHESFYYRPGPQNHVVWLTEGLDAQHQPVRQLKPSLTVTLDETNVAPLSQEPYSLPREMRARKVQFVSVWGSLPPPKVYWKAFGQMQEGDSQSYIGKPKDVERALSGVINSTATPEQNLRALYARALTLRNLRLEALQPGGVRGLKKIHDNNSVKDVLKHGYGYPMQINDTFIALARAAGFKAWDVLTSSRDGQFFSEDVPSGDQMDGNLALVEVSGKDVFLDPGMGCPYGVIPWYRTMVTGMKLTRKGGELITTAPATTAEDRITRTGDFNLWPDGTLSGTLVVRYGGGASYSHTFDALARDDTARRRHLVDEVRGWLPQRATVTFQNVNGWQTSEPELVARFVVKISNFAIPAGARLLLPQGILETTAKPMFPSPKRTGQVYFHRPWRTADDLRIALPPGMTVESTPKPVRSPAASALRYNCALQSISGGLEWRRRLAVEEIVLPVKFYPTLRAFFDFVRQNDQRQAVLREAAATPGQP